MMIPSRGLGFHMSRTMSDVTHPANLPYVVQEQLGSKYKHVSSFHLAGDLSAIVLFCVDTNKISDVYITSSNGNILCNLFTTGSFGDNFTNVKLDGINQRVYDSACNRYKGINDKSHEARVENFVFGNLKLAEHMSFIDRLAHADSEVTLYSMPSLERTEIKPAYEFLYESRLSICNAVIKLYEGEQKSKKRYDETDSVVALCLETRQSGIFDTILEGLSNRRDKFTKLKTTYLQFCNELMNRIPSSYRMVVKLGVGRGINHNTIIPLFANNIPLEIGVGLVRAYFATQQVNFCELLLFLSSGSTQEFSFDDDKWAIKVSEDLVDNAKTAGSLGFFMDPANPKYAPLLDASVQSIGIARCLGRANMYSKFKIAQGLGLTDIHATNPYSGDDGFQDALYILEGNGWLQWMHEFLGVPITTPDFSGYPKHWREMLKAAIKQQFNIHDNIFKHLDPYANTTYPTTRCRFMLR